MLPENFQIKLCKIPGEINASHKPLTYPLVNTEKRLPIPSWNTMSFDLRKILTKIIFSISSNCPWYGSFEKYIKNMPRNPEKYAELSEYWTQMKFQILPQTVDSVTCYVIGYWFFHRKLEGHTSVYLFFMISFNGRGCGEIMRKFGQIEQQLLVFWRLA